MSELAVLFEDNAHESLLRQLLKRVYGLTPPKVRYRRCVDCVGVERALVEEIRFFRSKNFQVSRGLLVVIDADEYGVDGRKRRLDRLLGESGLAGRQDTERVAYVVPRLEAENWSAFLLPVTPPRERRAGIQARSRLAPARCRHRCSSTRTGALMADSTGGRHAFGARCAT